LRITGESIRLDGGVQCAWPVRDSAGANLAESSFETDLEGENSELPCFQRRLKMTPEEHRLVIYVLAQQLRHIKTILEILKRRGILEGADSQAFASSVFLDDEATLSALREAKADYLNLAKLLGVQTGLESLA
jgi:hypothetical protein